MALADRSTAPKQRGPSCSIGKMLATFTPDNTATGVFVMPRAAIVNETTVRK